MRNTTSVVVASELSVVVRDDDFDEDVVVTNLDQILTTTARVTLERVDV